jgi:uncharacterized membrane protein YdjX (TVP38/TMEM64 family)
MPTASRVRLLIILVVVAALGVLVYVVLWTEQGRQIKEAALGHLETFLEWAREHRFSGAAAMVVIYCLACVLFVPGSILTLGAGFAFGVGVGFVAVFLGANLGALAAFLLGRTLVRGWIEKKVMHNPRFLAIDRAVGEQGFKIVLLLRLSPVFPFSLLNYALGLTRVSLRDYALASLIGMVPGILMYVYLGSLVHSVAELVAGKTEHTPAERILFYVGLAATVAVTIFVTRIARRALAAAVPGGEPVAPQGESRG